MSKYKYQVVVHYPHYPSSILFEKEEDAWAYYEKTKGVSLRGETPLVTICEVISTSGVMEYGTEITWDLSNDE